MFDLKQVETAIGSGPGAIVAGGLTALENPKPTVNPLVEKHADALGKVNNTRLPATTRQVAMDTIETGLRWIDQGQTDDIQGTGSPYSTDLTTGQVKSDFTPKKGTPGVPLNQIPFDDRTVDALPGDLPQLPNDPSPTLSGLFEGEDNGVFGPTPEPSGPGHVSPAGDSNTGMGTEFEPVAGFESDQSRPQVDDMGTPAGDQPGTAESPIVGEPINCTWTAFTLESGTLNIPRKLIPKIKSASRPLRIQARVNDSRPKRSRQRINPEFA